MQFDIEAGELARILTVVKGCIAPRSTLPIFQHVLVEATAGRVSVRASDATMEACASAPADVKEDGSAALPGTILHGIAKGLPKSALVTIEPDGSHFKVTSSRSSYKLGSLPADHFPIMQRLDGVEFAIPAADLKGLLDATLPSVGNDERYYLRGVYLHIIESNERRLVAVSTDGHCLTRIDMLMPEGGEGIPNVIIPTATVNELSAFLGGVDGDVKVLVAPTRLSVSRPDCEIVSKLIDGEYPAYDRFIPPLNGALATVRSDVMIEAVERAKIVLASSTEKGHSVGLAHTDSGITILAGGKRGHVEEATERVDATANEPWPEFGVSAALLSQTLKLFDGADVDIQQAHPNAPILFTSPAKPALTCVVMPMRR